MSVSTFMKLFNVHYLAILLPIKSVPNGDVTNSNKYNMASCINLLLICCVQH